MKLARMLVYFLLSASLSVSLLFMIAGIAFAAPAHAKVLSATPSTGSGIGRSIALAATRKRTLATPTSERQEEETIQRKP